MERPIFSEEHIIELGKTGYSDYSYQADNSDVPMDFLDISRTLMLDLFPEASSKDLANATLGGGFKTEQDAWTAIKYAEAVSKLKVFHSEIEGDEEISVTEEEINEARLVVGLALLNEGDDDYTYVIKDKVEKYFEVPANRIKTIFLASYADEGIIH